MNASDNREFIPLGTLIVPRIIVGLWQLSSQAWGPSSIGRIQRQMLKYYNAGYTAFADHYGSSETVFGQFRKALPDPRAVIGATKWCVFQPMVITRSVVDDQIKERKERMLSNHLDFLQFHWQDYEDRQYLDALRHLQDIRDEGGSITEVGLVNFDAIRLDEICSTLPGLVVSNQVPFSLIDTRPLDGMDHVCERQGVKLLTYGTLCGGFLSDKWLDADEPDLYSNVLTPSQRKYLDIILNGWGSWELFQELLSTLKTIGNRHGGRSVANVATRWVLDHDFVACVIVGVRMGVSDHSQDNDKAYGFRLSKEDMATIERVLDKSRGRELFRTLGDCGMEYRTK